MDVPDTTDSPEQTFISYTETPDLSKTFITQLAQVSSGPQRSQQSSRQNSPIRARGASIKTDNDTELASPVLSEVMPHNEVAQRGNLSRNRAIHRSRASPALSDSSAAQSSPRMQQIGSSNVFGSPSTSSTALSENGYSGANTSIDAAPSVRSPPLPRRFSPASLSTGVGIGVRDVERTIQRSSTSSMSSPVSSSETGEGTRMSTSQSLRSDTSIQTNPITDRTEHVLHEKALPWQPLKSHITKANTSNSLASSESSYGSDSSAVPVRSPDTASIRQVQTESQPQTDSGSPQSLIETLSHSTSQQKYAENSSSLSNSAPFSADSRIATQKDLQSPLQTPNTSPLQLKSKGVRSSAANLPSSSSFQQINRADNSSSSNKHYSETWAASNGFNQIPQSRSEYVTQWRNGDPNSRFSNKPLQAVDGHTSILRSPASRLRDMSPSRRISTSKVSSSNPSTPRLMSSSKAPGAATHHFESDQRSSSSLSIRTREANAPKHTNHNLTSPSPSRGSNFAVQDSPSIPSGSSMPHSQQKSSADMQSTSPEVAPARIETGHEEPVSTANVAPSRETPTKRVDTELASTTSSPYSSSSRTFAAPALGNEQRSHMTSRPSETVSSSSRPVPAPPVPPRPGVAAGSNSNVPGAKPSTPSRPTNGLEQSFSPSQRSLTELSPATFNSRLRRETHLEASPLTNELSSTAMSSQQAGSDSPGSVYSLYAQEETPLSESAPRSTKTVSSLPQHSPFKPGASPSVPDYTPSPTNPNDSMQQPLSPAQAESATWSPHPRFTDPNNASQAMEETSATPSTAYSTPYILNGTPSLPSGTPKLSGSPALSSAGTSSLPKSTSYLPNTSYSSGGRNMSSPIPESPALSNARKDYQTSQVEETPFIEGTPSIASDTPYLGPEETRHDNSYSALGLQFPFDANASLLRRKVSHASIASSRSSYSDSNESDPVPHTAPAEVRESRIDNSIPEHSTPTTVQAGDMPGANSTKWSEIPGSRVPSTSSEAITSPLQGLSDTFANAMADLGLDDSVPPPIQGLDSVAIAYRTSPDTGRGVDAQPNTTLESLLPPRTEAQPTSEYGYTKLAPRADAKPQVSSIAPTQESLKQSLKVSKSSKEPTPTMPPAPKLEVYGMTIWWPTSFDATSNVNWDSTSTMQRCHLQARAANDLMDRDTNLTRWMMQLRQVQPRNAEAQLDRVASAQRQKHEAAFLSMLDAAISNASQSALAPDTSGMQMPTSIPYPFLAQASKEHPQQNEALSPQLNHSQSFASLHAPHSSRLDPGAAMRGAAGAAGAGWQRLQGAMPRVPSSSSFVMSTLGRRNSRRLRDPPSQPAQAVVTPHSTVIASTSAPQRRPLHRASYYELSSPRSAPVHEIGQNLGQKSIRNVSRQSEASNEPRFGLGIPGVGSRMGEDLRSVTPALLAGSLNLPPSVSRPNLAFENNLKRVMDALPDLDEATARKYLQQAQGDDVRAVSEYMQSQGDTSRRSFFSRTPRTR